MSGIRNDYINHNQVEQPINIIGEEDDMPQAQNMPENIPNDEMNCINLLRNRGYSITDNVRRFTYVNNGGKKSKKTKRTRKSRKTKRSRKN